MSGQMSTSAQPTAEVDSTSPSSSKGELTFEAHVSNSTMSTIPSSPTYSSSSSTPFPDFDEEEAERWRAATESDEDFGWPLEETWRAEEEAELNSTDYESEISDSEMGEMLAEIYAEYRACDSDSESLESESSGSECICACCGLDLMEIRAYSEMSSSNTNEMDSSETSDISDVTESLASISVEYGESDSDSVSKSASEGSCGCCSSASSSVREGYEGDDEAGLELDNRAVAMIELVRDLQARVDAMRRDVEYMRRWWTEFERRELRAA